MGFYDLERAARDPNYRMMYEHQQRQDKFDRETAQARARSTSSVASPVTTGNDAWSFLSSPGASAAPLVSASADATPTAGRSPSGDLPETAQEIAGLAVLFLCGSAFAAFFMGGFTWGRAFAASVAGYVLLWLLVNYWRPVLVVAAALAGIQIAKLYFG
ncbi:MAG: hypothetical protein ACTHKQ_25695 [Mesorhizobium sp.]